MDDDVDLVFLEHAHVDLNAHRRGGAEEDIGYLGGYHGSAPPIGQGSTAALFGDVGIILIDSDVGAVP